MCDMTTSSDSLAIIPQASPITLYFNVYHSTKPEVFGKDLEKAQYKSGRLNILTVGLKIMLCYPTLC